VGFCGRCLPQKRRAPVAIVSRWFSTNLQTQDGSNSPTPASNFGHVYAEVSRAVYARRAWGVLPYPTCVTRQHVHTVGDRGFCQAMTGGCRPPPDFSRRQASRAASLVAAP
jgi:hypothetical protein